jgi:hypothetical protein
VNRTTYRAWNLSALGVLATMNLWLGPAVAHESDPLTITVHPYRADAEASEQERLERRLEEAEFSLRVADGAGGSARGVIVLGARRCSSIFTWFAVKASRVIDRAIRAGFDRGMAGSLSRRCRRRRDTRS